MFQIVWLQEGKTLNSLGTMKKDTTLLLCQSTLGRGLEVLERVLHVK